jgi:ankyrin repeat protein
MSPSSAGLRDSKGRTFLHVAVENRKHKVVEFVCQEAELAWVLNAQDNEGNTAVHLAIRVGDFRSFCCLMQNRLVGLNVQNYKGLTPLDASCCEQNAGLLYGMVV